MPDLPTPCCDTKHHITLSQHQTPALASIPDKDLKDEVSRALVRHFWLLDLDVDENNDCILCI
jgi:hypothetical protein